MEPNEHDIWAGFFLCYKCPPITNAVNIFNSDINRGHSFNIFDCFPLWEVGAFVHGTSPGRGLQNNMYIAFRVGYSKDPHDVTLSWGQSPLLSPRQRGGGSSSGSADAYACAEISPVIDMPGSCRIPSCTCAARLMQQHVHDENYHANEALHWFYTFFFAPTSVGLFTAWCNSTPKCNPGEQYTHCTESCPASFTVLIINAPLSPNRGYAPQMDDHSYYILRVQCTNHSYGLPLLLFY